jgi:uncharacterized membrane protein
MEVPENNNIENNNIQSDVVAEGKTMAIVAYITLIGLIVAFVLNIEKKNSFANYHIRQSLGLGLTGLVLGMVNIIPLLGQLVSIIGFFILLVMWISGLMSALNGKEKPVFLLGEKYQEWFKGI